MQNNANNANVNKNIKKKLIKIIIIIIIMIMMIMIIGRRGVRVPEVLRREAAHLVREPAVGLVNELFKYIEMCVHHTNRTK